MEIPGVWYVPELTYSLLSTRRLKSDLGLWAIEGKDGDPSKRLYDGNDQLVMLCEEHPGGLLIPQMEVQLKDAALPVRPALLAVHQRARHMLGQALAAHPNRAAAKESALLWHQRTGHMNARALQRLVQHKKLQGITIPAMQFARLRNHVCDICVMAKLAAAPYASRRERATEVMQVLHSDLHFYEEATLGGAVCAVTLLDEYTNFCAVEPLKTKDESSVKLQFMVERWQTQTGVQCKRFYSDRGGEYIADTFKHWLASQGIIQQHSVPRTAQQNGKAEHLNLTLCGRVRSMLLHYNLPKCLWGHALAYAAILHNCGLNKRLDMTPTEAFSGTDPLHHALPHVRLQSARPCAAREAGRSLILRRSLESIWGLWPIAQAAMCWCTGRSISVKTNTSWLLFGTWLLTNTLCAGDTQVSDLRWGGPIPLPTHQGPSQWWCSQWSSSMPALHCLRSSWRKLTSRPCLCIAGPLQPMGAGAGQGTNPARQTTQQSGKWGA